MRAPTTEVAERSRPIERRRPSRRQPATTRANLMRLAIATTEAMMASMKSGVELVKATFKDFSEDEATWKAAAFAEQKTAGPDCGWR